MPQITAHRLWCKTCNDWNLFSKSFSDEEKGLKCDKCNTNHVDTILTEIPDEKITEQQERFKKQRREHFEKSYLEYLNPSNPFEETIGIANVIESDAGILAIEKAAKEKRDMEKATAIDDMNNHKHLGRNDKCICNSGEKYKNCCLSRINNYYSQYKVV